MENKMEKVILRPVAITDLNIRYARHMGGNKVRHYVLPALVVVKESLIGDDGGKNFLKHFIAETEGITDVEFVEARHQARHQAKTGQSAPLILEDVTDLVFNQPGDSKVVRSLKKLSAKQLIVEYHWYSSIFGKLYDKFIAFPWNRLLFRFNFWSTRFAALDCKYQHKFHRVKSLTVACKLDELHRAFEVLRQDLCTLNDLGLIEGHLAMPSVVELADTVGLGKNNVALFCFPVINEQRASKLLKKQQFELPNLYLELFNVISETPEGEIGYLDGVDLKDKYDIEEVQVGSDTFGELLLTSDEARDAHISSFENAKDWVNEVSSTQKKQLAKLEKESNSTTIFEESIDENGNPGKGFAVAVNVDVKLNRKE
jgi:hypothetical protein